MNPTISVDVDLGNPGQVFACCGLLELAHRLTPRDNRAVGWFEDIDRIQTEFQIKAYDKDGKAITLPSIMASLKECQITEPEYNNKEGPVLIGEPFNIIVDWRKAYPQNDSVKTWAGQQEIFSIIKELKRCLPKNDKITKTILNYSCLTNKSVTSFDISKSEDAIDVGFSHDKLKIYSLSTYIITELLTLIGLQRFSPRKAINKRYKRFYNVWDSPLCANIASSAICQSITGIKSKRFEFHLYRRDSGGRYKSFSNAKQTA